MIKKIIIIILCFCFSLHCIINLRPVKNSKYGAVSNLEKNEFILKPEETTGLDWSMIINDEEDYNSLGLKGYENANYYILKVYLRNKDPKEILKNELFMNAIDNFLVIGYFTGNSIADFDEVPMYEFFVEDWFPVGDIKRFSPLKFFYPKGRLVINDFR